MKRFIVLSLAIVLAFSFTLSFAAPGGGDIAGKLGTIIDATKCLKGCRDAYNECMAGASNILERAQCNVALINCLKTCKE